MGKPSPAVGTREAMPAVVHPNLSTAQSGGIHPESSSAPSVPDGSSISAQSDPEFFLHLEALRTLLNKPPLNKPPQPKPANEGSHQDAPALHGREFWKHVGGTPWMLYRMGEGLELAHEWMEANDGYQYVLIGLVVLAGMNLEGDNPTGEKLVRGLHQVAKHASAEIEDCTAELWDRWFAEEEDLNVKPGAVSQEDPFPNISWMFEQEIELQNQSYEVKVSQSGWIQVNGRLWKLADADTSRNAKITVEELSYDPERGLHFKVKGSVLFFSKEASKTLNVEQSAQLLDRLATSEEDPTTEQIRAAGIRLTKGPETARG